MEREEPEKLRRVCEQEEKTLEQCLRRPQRGRGQLPMSSFPRPSLLVMATVLVREPSPVTLRSGRQASVFESGEGFQGPRKVGQTLDEYSTLSLFPSIQLRYGDSWGERYGSPGGNEVTAVLNPEENVFGISGTRAAYISQISLVTDQPREILLGSRRGAFDYTDYPIDPSHKFRGLCGFYVPGGLKAIRILWGDGNSTCGQ